MFLYHFLAVSLFVLALPFLPLVWGLSEKRRANLGPRLGIGTGLMPRQNRAWRIWIHALSVGEVRSALPLVLEWGRQYPEAEIIFTASTKTGFDMARTLYAGQGDPRVSQIGYFPFDLPFSVSRISRLIDPNLVCLVETDLWPGFLHHMKKRRIPVVLANARLSQRSLKGYLRLGGFRHLFFSGLSCILAQTETDRGRFLALGIPGEKLVLAGNMKFDQPRVALSGTDLSSLGDLFGLKGAEGPVWICGSTHKGEEEAILGAYHGLKERHPGLKLILAPRDPKRSEKLVGAAQKKGIEAHLLSRGKNDPQVLLVDGMGILARAYALCDVAFVGGSLVASGGHNPLEPAMYGKPVLFGPHMEDFSEVADQLVSARAAFRVHSAADLAERVETLLADPDLREKTGANAGEFFSGNTGAVDKTLAILAREGNPDGQ